MDKIHVPNTKSRINKAESKIERLNMLAGFLGVNRSGKTVTAKKLAKQWRSTNLDGPIISYDPQLQFEDLTDFNIDPSNPDWAEDCINYSNALIILDDYRALHTKPNADKGLTRLMHFRNYKNIDIIYITHNPRLVLNLLSYYTTHYYIFYTSTQTGSFEDKIPNYEECIAASTIVNKYVIANKIMKRGDEIYPNFPYCVVDCSTGEVKCYNMSGGLI